MRVVVDRVGWQANVLDPEFDRLVVDELEKQSIEQDEIDAQAGRWRTDVDAGRCVVPAYSPLTAGTMSMARPGFRIGDKVQVIRSLSVISNRWLGKIFTLKTDLSDGYGRWLVCENAEVWPEAAFCLREREGVRFETPDEVAARERAETAEIARKRMSTRVPHAVRQFKPPLLLGGGEGEKRP